MNKIEEIVGPHKMEDVREVLHEIGVNGITFTEIKGLGRKKGHTETYRGSECVTDFLPKIELEVVDQVDQAQKIFSVIAKTLETGGCDTGTFLCRPSKRHGALGPTNLVRARYDNSIP